MGRNIKDLHSNSMKKLRDIVSKKIRIIYSDKSECVVPCTISDNTIEMLKYNEYVGKDFKIFNILIEDIISCGGKLVDFMYIEYNRVTYQVQNKIENGVYSNTISLVSLIHRGDING